MGKMPRLMSEPELEGATKGENRQQSKNSKRFLPSHKIGTVFSFPDCETLISPE